MPTPFPPRFNPDSSLRRDNRLKRVLSNLETTLERDHLVAKITNDLQKQLEVNRVVLYYFYRQWKGQVTFEALSSPEFSIFGSTGPDECFNQEYAQMYLKGRVRAIADIENEAIAECHRDFLRSLKVRSNLVVPILNSQGLWGLLVAHHCQSVHFWADEDIATMQQGAELLASTPSISGNKEI